MLSWLISTSVHGRVVVLALCALLIAYGFQTTREAPLDVFPEFAPPKIEIQTEAQVSPPTKSKASSACH